ncbi:MAG: sodium:proton antiporter [Actinomycetota bacterium]|nr:sodium:proton antiporter [Actinomycetota bacterium]
MVEARPEVLDDEPSHRPAVGILLVAGVAGILTAAVLALPREDAPLPAIARYAMTVALPQWHTTEPVSEVVYGTRGFDTFGETFLLLAAIVGTSTITRRRERRRGFIGEELAGLREQRQVGATPGSGEGVGSAEARQAWAAETEEQGDRLQPVTPDDTPIGTPGPETAVAMSVVVRAAVRAVAPILFLAGFYLVAWGYSPGGGFPGGAVLLGVVLFVYVAYGYRRVEPVIRPGLVEPVELAGALAIIAIEAFGLFLKGSFSANFLPLGPVGTIRSGGVLQAFSVSEFIEVATGLILVVFGLLSMGHDWTELP